MKLVVTGSAGHLGEALMKALRSDGHDLVGVDVIASPDTTVVGSILDRALLAEAMAGAAAVIHAATLHKPHLATHSAQQFIDTNISGTLAVLEQAVRADVPAVVYVSTTSAFGQALNPPPGQPAAWITEETLGRPKNLYGATKTAAEELCELVQRDHRLGVVVLRMSRFFPEDDDAPDGLMVDPLNAKVNELLHRRVDIADVVDACMRAVESAPAVGFGRYIVSATTPFAENDAPELRRDPAALLRRLYPDVEEIYAGLGWRLPGGIDRVYVNARARSELGWEPVWDFRRALDCLARGDDPRSRLSVEVGAKGYHDQPTGVYTTGPRDESAWSRRSTWEYYDRRVAQAVPGIANAAAYWTGLGVSVTTEQVAVEAAQVQDRLKALSEASFVEVGAGPGTFTGMLDGRGVAVDQSAAALLKLRRDYPRVAAVRADATALPFRDGSFERYFAAHLYGLLQTDDRSRLMEEARRVAAEVVILDAGRPDGVAAAEWQDRSLPDGGRYRIYRRHFEAGVLALEIDGTVLFDGSLYVLVASGA